MVFNETLPRTFNNTIIQYRRRGFVFRVSWRQNKKILVGSSGLSSVALPRLTLLLCGGWRGDTGILPRPPRRSSDTGRSRQSSATGHSTLAGVCSTPASKRTFFIHNHKEEQEGSPPPPLVCVLLLFSLFFPSFFFLSFSVFPFNR